MGTWHKTGCLLCAQNCGLEVLVEDGRIVKSRGDKDNPRSLGYLCNKGVKVAHFQHHAGRLRYPLKRVNGGFERVSWDQAIREIAERLGRVIEDHGPRSLALVGGGGQGSHFDAAFGLTLLRALGSRYHYSALAQELTGYFWVCGRMVGRQNRFLIPDEHHAELLLAVGWNGMLSHQMPRAPVVLRDFSKSPDKLLVVIDPRNSETAALANHHVALRPGTDALLVKAMIALILQEGWEDRAYLAAHVTGFAEVERWFSGFDIPAALQVCQLEMAQVRDLCRLLTTRRWCMHADLGTLMNRHSTLTSYLQLLLMTVCGRLCVTGGNVIPGSMVPMGSHSDERNPKTWRTRATDFPPILGCYPPNVLPEEITSDHPERLRALFVCNANPLRSYADTSAYERAFDKLDLSVTIDVAMSETAQKSDYVLPARTGFESWDGTFFAWTYPEVYFQLRRPVVAPEGEALEAGEIFTRIAEEAGLMPPIPRWLDKAADLGRWPFSAALGVFLARHPKAVKVLPFVVGKTLGRAMDSPHRAAFWGAVMAASVKLRRAAPRVGLGPAPWSSALTELARSRGASLLALVPPLSQTERLYQAIIDRAEGLWVGRVDADQNMAQLATADGKIAAVIPELAEELRSLHAEAEAEAIDLGSDYPFVLNAGWHGRRNANTLLRDPAWLGAKRGCTLALHPDDGARLQLSDGDTARVSTEAGQVTIEVELTDQTRPGMVLMPHGHGLVHDGVQTGVNVNLLTQSTHRDGIAATPLHRFVPCRVEKAGGA
ncbi:MAG: molybdopterin-dependent oxidoreductase [Deltaproteobacteria bacterium]|nr:molybdopterin-dependent oxidoreductase [Deltaproteobacteria bacterium]